jgi:predicted dehydrogenase
VKTAVVGLGIGMAHVAAYLRSAEAELVAVADAWEPRLTHVGGTFDQGSMLVLKPLFTEQQISRRWEDIGIRACSDIQDIAEDDEIELVSLCTPDYLHQEHAVLLLEAGKHIILEKPVALTIEGSNRIREAAESSGRRVAVAYEFRLNPGAAALRELISAGTLGEVKAFSLHHFRKPFRRDKWNKWIQSESTSGGLIVEETSHWFDLARFLTAEEFATVHTVGTDAIHPDFNYEDVAFCQGRFTNGSAWQISHALTGFDFNLTIQVHGTEGTAWLGLKEGTYTSLDNGASKYWGILSHAPLNADPEDAIIRIWDSEAGEPKSIRDNVETLVNCFKTGSEFPTTLNDAVEALRVALAARESLNTGKVINLL